MDETSSQKSGKDEAQRAPNPKLTKKILDGLSIQTGARNIYLLDKKIQKHLRRSFWLGLVKYE